MTTRTPAPTGGSTRRSSARGGDSAAPRAPAAGATPTGALSTARSAEHGEGEGEQRRPRTASAAPVRGAAAGAAPAPPAAAARSRSAPASPRSRRCRSGCSSGARACGASTGSRVASSRRAWGPPAAAWPGSSGGRCGTSSDWRAPAAAAVLPPRRPSPAPSPRRDRHGRGRRRGTARADPGPHRGRATRSRSAAARRLGAHPRERLEGDAPERAGRDRAGDTGAQLRRRAPDPVRARRLLTLLCGLLLVRELRRAV